MRSYLLIPSFITLYGSIKVGTNVPKNYYYTSFRVKYFDQKELVDTGYS